MGEAKRKREKLGLSKQEYRKKVEEELFGELFLINSEEKSEAVFVAHSKKQVVKLLENQSNSCIVGGRVSVKKSDLDNYLVVVDRQHYLDSAIKLDHALILAQKTDEALKKFPLKENANTEDFNSWVKENAKLLVSFPSYIVQFNPQTQEYQKIIYDPANIEQCEKINERMFSINDEAHKNYLDNEFLID